MAMQMTSFLQTAIVFLLLTNMISALVAFYAMKAAHIRGAAAAQRRARTQAAEPPRPQLSSAGAAPAL
jgi:hypothetical protein